MAEALQLEHVVKVYAGGNRALDDISLDVPPGTFVVLLGPSGSGKTSLLRCLAGIERITSGHITIGETRVADAARHIPPERRNLSMVFQDYALWPHLAARDNVAFALRRNGIGRSARRAEADATLDLVGLRGLEHRYPGELSGGEQQRVALARALIAGTGLILCDEPLSNLDADLRERMRVEISMRVRASGATTVYITHDQAEAFALADLLGVLEKGRLVQLGTPEQVYTQPATPFVARFTGLAGELPARLRGERSDGAVAVEPTGLTFARPLHVHLQEQHPGSGDAILAIRPAAIRLCAPDSDERHLVGTVADVAFRDRAYEHAVELDDGSKITGIHHPRRAQRGETVGLQLDPEGCLIFPRAHTGQP